MICPECGCKTQILRTANRADGTKYRRRECPECEAQFSTWETPVRPKPNAHKRSTIDKFLDIALKRA